MITNSLNAKLLHQLAVMREEVLYMTFLDLHKVYDALNKDIWLDILEGYGVGPQDRHIRCKNWKRIRMVDRTGGYYRAAFKFFRGVTHGDPLHPTIFNMVVDAVLWHWILLEEGVEGGQDGWRREVRHCTTFFYTDDRLVSLTDPVWM